MLKKLYKSASVLHIIPKTPIPMFMSIIPIPHYIQTALIANMNNHKAFHFTVIWLAVSTMSKIFSFSGLNITPIIFNNTHTRTKSCVKFNCREQSNKPVYRCIVISPSIVNIVAYYD